MSESKSNKFAFLILAHTDPMQLKRLVHSLDYPQFDIYVHVDKKKDIKEFGFENYGLRFSRLTVIENRYDIIWGNISIVKATVEMYKIAMKTDTYSRFITLSGLDYPIRSNREIYNTLNEENVEFIMGNPISGSEFNKVQCLYIRKNPLLFRLFVFLYKNLHIKFRNESLTLSSGENYKIFFAPQWHALSYECVAFILEQLEKHPEIWRYFKHSYAPDELLIPTLVFNSKFLNNTLKSDFEKDTHYNYKVAIHHINYEPVVEVFDEKNYDSIIKSNKLFFRKAKSGVSDTLLNMIDLYRKE